MVGSYSFSCFSYLFFCCLCLLMFSVSKFLIVSFYSLLTFIELVLCTDVLSLVWLKRTVAVLWYRICRGGC